VSTSYLVMPLLVKHSCVVCYKFLGNFVKLTIRYFQRVADAKRVCRDPLSTGAAIIVITRNFSLLGRFCNPDNQLLIRHPLDPIELYKTPYRKPGIEI
jgi:hypothetical protein